MKTKMKQGFTLLEILLVVAAIAILAGIVIVAINPGKQLADTRNAQRKADVNTILNAVYQYSIDNRGNLPAEITTTEKEICVTGGVCTGLVNMTNELTNAEKYLVSIPLDPVGSNATSAGYSIKKSNNGRVTVNAADAEQSVLINATR
jgi:prepilin-type N-terminal cleavage/methylation domain-containing protein